MTGPQVLRATAATLFATLLPVSAAAQQFTMPNVITATGDVTTTLGQTVFINHGMVGVGRLPASGLDTFGETLGSVSGMQVTDWAPLGNGSYAGTLNFLPDRGFNSDPFFSDYAARIQRVSFVFTPFTGKTNIGGTGVPEKIALQKQIFFTSPVSGVQFTYFDPGAGAFRNTTGLDPGTSSISLFGKTLPYVTSYLGPKAPGAPVTTFNGINKLAVDAEALIIKNDGSGYIGDEYGAHIYYFNPAKQIVGAIVPPQAMEPHTPAGTLNFNSIAAPVNGRRNNQGLEGVALSPDGTRLFALLQSATIQDSGGSNANRRQTRLLVYDVSSNPTPNDPMLMYALTLPTYRTTGDGAAVDSTAAQSEIFAIDNNRLLVLSRDANGLGAVLLNKSVIKSVYLLDLSVGAPTDLHDNAAVNAEGGRITVPGSPGVLAPGITPLTWSEAVNVLNTTQLGWFNILLDQGGASQVNQLTLGEKWEGLSLMPANDPAAPNDYFLFVGNDNDFLTTTGVMRGPDATDPIVHYNAFANHPANRQPSNAGDGSLNENDTMFLAFRVTLAATPVVDRGGFVLDRRTGRFLQQMTLKNDTPDTISGPVYLVIDGLSSNATLDNKSGTTVSAPAGNPYIAVVPAGGSLPPGGSASVTLQFTNPSRAAITYNTRVLALTAPAVP